MTPERTSEMPAELAFRAVDGLEITLSWDRTEDRLSVTVFDSKQGDFFEIDAPRDRALDAFHHPFAYAARQGVETGVVVDLADYRQAGDLDERPLAA